MIKSYFKSLFISLILGVIPGMAPGETIGLFYNPLTPQHAFAAGDIKTALESQNFTVEINDLSTLIGTYAGKKVVIALASDVQVTSFLTAQGGSSPTGLGEQAYALRTTATPQLSYWVWGGDDNGAMYGGLQIAENIDFNGFSGFYNEEQSPHLKNRGIKFNIPLDKNSPTYFYNNGGTSHRQAIQHVWDMSFWETWFDEMARHRYNVLSLWSPHPFTSMVNMEDEYPGIAIQGVTGYNKNDSEIQVNTMAIDEKIAFWRQVMQYGRDRGFGTYFCTWNIFLSTARDKHGITDVPSNQATRTYLRKCIKKFLETYPDLAGFGITVGERMGDLTNNQKEEWAWDTYGRGMMEYAQAHPDRDLVFIHRQHQGNLSDILQYFRPLIDLPNVQLDLSFKYSEAHAHAVVKPTYWDSAGMKNALDGTGNTIKSWLTIRNDDWYFLHWADPQFVRDYVNQFPVRKYVDSFYIGSDGWVFTKVFTSKDSYYEDNDALDIQRTWYMQMLWGRISYNPSISDDLFKNYLALKYPQVSSENLFQAWSKASRAVRLANEQVTGTWKYDFDWWPEGWTSSSGFRTLNDTRSANPMSGSNLCSISNTAKNTCSGRLSALTNADQIDQLAQDALTIIAGMNAGSNTELMLTMKDIEAMAYLGLYTANKFRSAVYLEQANATYAKDAIGTACAYWQQYTDLMDQLYRGVKLQRNRDFNTWHDRDSDVWKEYYAMDTEPPTPNPAEFDELPAALSSTQISMTAKIGMDDTTSSVEYLFEEAGGVVSGWQTSPAYIATNLNPGTEYTHTVKMRDLAGNETAPSAPFSAFTYGDPDIVKNHFIDLNDFAALVARWLDSDCYISDLCGGADLNADGAVDLEDFQVLAVHWRTDVAPPGFKESGGLVCMEAEHYDGLEQRAEPETWKQASETSGYVGAGYMWTDGNFTVTIPSYTQGTRMLYSILFSTTGTFTVYVRRYSDSDRQSNSAWAGLDGVSTGVNDNTYNLDQWVWKSLGTVSVSSPGVKTLDIVRREEGYKIDRIVLTQGASPTGVGPPESPR